MPIFIFYRSMIVLMYECTLDYKLIFVITYTIDFRIKVYSKINAYTMLIV